MFRNAVPTVRAFSLSGVVGLDHSDMSVSCGMFVSINVDEAERVGCPDGKGSI